MFSERAHKMLINAMLRSMDREVDDPVVVEAIKKAQDEESEEGIYLEEGETSSMPGWELEAADTDDDDEDGGSTDFVEVAAPLEKDDNDDENIDSVIDDTLKTDTISDGDTIVAFSWFEKYYAWMARHPWKHFGVAWTITIVLSIVGMVVGEFAVSVDNAGWTSRGTLISNRQTQTGLTLWYRNELFQPNNDAVWEDLLNNVQPGWETISFGDRRRLQQTDGVATTTPEYDAQYFASKNGKRMRAAKMPRLLLEESAFPGLDSCAIDWCVLFILYCYFFFVNWSI
jgi:hypothetical protein